MNREQEFEKLNLRVSTCFEQLDILTKKLEQDLSSSQNENIELQIKQLLDELDIAKDELTKFNTQNSKQNIIKNQKHTVYAFGLGLIVLLCIAVYKIFN